MSSLASREYKNPGAVWCRGFVSIQMSSLASRELVARFYNKGLKAKLNIPDNSPQALEFIDMIRYAQTVENRNSHRVKLSVMGEHTFY